MIAHFASAATAPVNFNQPARLLLPVIPRDVAAGDFDGDGDADLAVSGGNGVLILRNRSESDWSLVGEYRAAGPAFHLSVADLNGDGNLDVAAADEGGISVFTGNGDGTFRLTSTNRTEASTRWIAVGLCCIADLQYLQSGRAWEFSLRAGR